MGSEETAMEARMARVESCLWGGNGSMGLEDKIKEYVDKRDEHKENNLRQEIMDLRSENDGRHAENRGNFSKLFTWTDQFDGALKYGKIIGSVIAFLCMAILALLGYLAASRTPHTTGLTDLHSPIVAQHAQQDAEVK